jgi:plastocyanin
VICSLSPFFQASLLTRYTFVKNIKEYLEMKHKSEFVSLLKIYLVPLIGLLLITLFYAGCNEDESTSPPPPPSNPNAVSIVSNTFNPANRSVQAGTTITWTNNDNVAHTVTSGTPQNPTSNIFDSGSIPPGGTFQHTFSQAGSFAYYCTLHPTMTAQITVQ